MSEEQTKIKEEEKETDPFTRLMFGQQVQREAKETKKEEPLLKNRGEEYYALMEQVDSIMESVNKLKPMLKEFSPIIDFFKKK
ncbi:hypothetical protein [Sutcliffiella deserti]|uniref:hypothetical protein n=1 Tax=Sutcliffiella deserti TaxID=2875501 RepID=UPI001CBFE349|nr:hypothetical protein [Sutcliffiella deserti]